MSLAIKKAETQLLKEEQLQNQIKAKKQHDQLMIQKAN